MTVIALSLVLVLCIGASLVSSCTDFYMNFTSFSLSGRSMDLGGLQNWTITSWPRKLDGYGSESSYYWWPAKYGTVGISANWLGDDNYALPMLFGDSLNEKGLSCSSLALEGTQYQQKSLRKQNLFFGVFCLYVTQTYDNVLDLMDALREIAVWGIDDVAQHYVIRDSTGDSLVVEFVGGEQKVYLDRNDGVDGFGIMTNEPTYDWHVSNVLHYEWKRSLTRQAVVIPGNFYPEERYLRTHMIKSGMQDQGLMADVVDFQTAFSLTVQVLNTVTVPQGDQYGTDTGSVEGSKADHSMFGLVRDHKDLALYWRDSTNPTFRAVRLRDLDLSEGAAKTSMKMETGPFYIDMTNSMA